MRKRVKSLLLSLVLCLQLIVPVTVVEAATTLYDNETGNQDGYDYELWKDYGTTSMTLNSGGTFSCQWSDIGNALFRKGIKFDCTKTYSQIGAITVDYGSDYQPSGNSYLCVYGWSKDPLVEYYIVESWGTWRPPGATSKGTITVDGGTYDVYETTREQQPSIEGTKTFQQYWSVRTTKRTSGTISVTEHFKAWERMGLQLGKIYETALTVEGYQSSGSANVYKNTISVGAISGNTGNTGNTGGSTTGSGTATKIECEAMSISGQYARNISSPFSGVALYANDDACTFTQYFANDTHDFTLRGASNGSNMAKVDLVIGGVKKGTFYFGDQYPAEYTIENVSHGTGEQTIKLVVSEDDGNWDAFVDYLSISGAATSGNTGNTGSGSSASAKVECEAMSISGQYAGNISSPFSGVALYTNDDACTFTQYFASNTHDFTLRGASDGSNMAKVDLVIGGVKKGTFYFGDQYPAEYTIENVSHGTGEQTIKLVVSEDDGQWDAFVDYLTISAPGTAGNSGNTGTITSSTKMVALTFDDGPSVTTTTQILDILERYDVKSTFFLIGNEINSSTQSILQRQSKQGHELANHSYSHSDMTTMSWSQVQNEINQTSSAIKNITGQTVKFFRPPYISVNNTMYSAIGLAFIQGIMCDDWVSSTSASQRAQTVLSTVSDGSIILLHDFEGNTNTVEALPTIIEGLKAQGYTFVTLSEMFQAKGKNPNVDNKIWSNVND